MGFLLLSPVLLGAVESWCKTQIVSEIPPDNYVRTLDRVIIRIRTHIISDNNGNGGLTNDQATNAITVMANDFHNGGIYFYMAGSDEIHDDYYYSNFNDEKFDQLIQEYGNPDAIDIFLLPLNKYFAGSARKESKALVVGGTEAQVPFAGSSLLSHEMGHCLWLKHTHHGTSTDPAEQPPGSCPEEIDWSNCEDCGDYVCDTPADIGLRGEAGYGGGNYYVDDNCNYTGNTKDDPNMDYDPDTHNIESYSHPECMTHFTSGQFERMFHYIESESVLAPVKMIPSTSEPVPDAPSSLSWTNSGGHPRLNWNPSQTTDIVGYRIYRNLSGCANCAFNYLGYTVGYEADTFTDWEVTIVDKFPSNQPIIT